MVRNQAQQAWISEAARYETAGIKPTSLPEPWFAAYAPKTQRSDCFLHLPSDHRRITRWTGVTVWCVWTTAASAARRHLTNPRDATKVEKMVTCWILRPQSTERKHSFEKSNFLKLNFLSFFFCHWFTGGLGFILLFILFFLFLSPFNSFFLLIFSIISLWFFSFSCLFFSVTFI